MIKVGDYVVVVGGDYTWTVPGSWGRVEAITNDRLRPVRVRFEWVNQQYKSDSDTFMIKQKDLAPLTKLHKLLYGIDDET